jgi:hypothetical protein
MCSLGLGAVVTYLLFKQKERYLKGQGTAVKRTYGVLVNLLLTIFYQYIRAPGMRGSIDNNGVTLSRNG